MSDRMTAAEFSAQFGGGKPANPVNVGRNPAPAKPQIRIPKKAAPNKTEAHASQFLVREFPGCDVRYEALTFRLNSGTIYTPDWTVWRGNTLLLCVEVKARWMHRDASKEKFKQALAEWPSIKWRFMQKNGSEFISAES